MGVWSSIGRFISTEYKENTQVIWNLIEGWKFFLQHEVVVGIPEEFNVGEKNGMTSASLLYLHENGVPSHNIVPRPVLRPALAQSDIAEQIKELMMEAAEAALVKGDRKTAEANFEKAGMIGAGACKDYILSGALAPNKPRTIARKGSAQPLVDTGAMLGSINYVVIIIRIKKSSQSWE